MCSSNSSPMLFTNTTVSRLCTHTSKAQRTCMLIRFSIWPDFPFSVVSQKCVRIVPARVDCGI